MSKKPRFMVLGLTLFSLLGVRGETRPSKFLETQSAPVSPETTVRVQVSGRFVGVPLVDGSKNPAQISDEVAVRAFFQSIKVSPNPTAADVQRLRSHAARMNLNEPDFQALKELLGRFHMRLADQKARIEAQRQIARNAQVPATLSRYLDEHARLSILAVETYNEALRSLSPEGATKLREYLAHVKTRIKIFPSPDMSAHLH